MKLKLIKLGIIGVVILITLIGKVFADEIITIAATPVPQAEILKQIKPILKKQGIDLQIKEFNDYIQPNLLVQQKQLDANFFQHLPYLQQFNQDHKTNLVSLIAVEIEPMGLYVSNDPQLSKFATTKDIRNLPKQLIIGVPNDTTNEGRALLLLQQHGLIKLNSKITYPTKKDILDNGNPYNLDIRELDPAMLPRALMAKQVALAVINSNYALDAKINPLKDAIFIEDFNSPYVNIIAVRPDELTEPKMKKLAEVIKSPAIRSYINTRYKGAVISVTK
jgi:D-methionine transport system substrate-binding protein